MSTSKDREALVQLSILHQELQEKYKSQEELLVEVSKMLQAEMSKDVSATQEQKTLEWVREMYDYRSLSAQRNRLASKTKPKITSNTPKNRIWIAKTESLCIELGIMYKSQEGTLWARMSKGEALQKMEEYYNKKRRVIIDA